MFSIKKPANLDLQVFGLVYGFALHEEFYSIIQV